MDRLPQSGGNVDFATLDFRSHWESTGKDETVKLHLVPTASEEYSAITVEFNKTLANQLVDKVERVENAFQYAQYTAHVAKVKQSVGTQFNPTMNKMLFHGTNSIDTLVNPPKAGKLRVPLRQG